MSLTLTGPPSSDSVRLNYHIPITRLNTSSRSPTNVHQSLPTEDCQLPTADCQLPTADCQLPTANCQLPTADCQLPTADCSLFTILFQKKKQPLKRAAFFYDQLTFTPICASLQILQSPLQGLDIRFPVNHNKPWYWAF